MKIAKLYAFYEKNDIRMLDRYGNPILLKIGCTTATSVKKRVQEQSKGTIVSDNVIVWGQDNDKIATWYDGAKDADKEFHSFIKIRKPEAYRPDVGSEVFELSIREVEALYQEFVKINSLSQKTIPVYKITLENSKMVIEKIFNEHCMPEIQQQMLCKLSSGDDCGTIDFENDSLFLSVFSKRFMPTINSLSQNPLSEPGLDIKLWDYVVEYKNSCISKTNEEYKTRTIYADMDYLEEAYKNIQKNMSGAGKGTAIDINKILSSFSNIKLKDGYELELRKGRGGQLCIRKIGALKSVNDAEYGQDEWLKYVEIKNAQGYIDLIIFRRFVSNLYRNYMGAIYDERENLFCQSAINDWLGARSGVYPNYFEDMGENATEVANLIQKTDCRPFVKINADGTKSVFELHVWYPGFMTIYWQEYIISEDPMCIAEQKNITEIYESSIHVNYD